MSSSEISSAQLRSGQSRVFALLWGAYASYYLCRLNFAVAQPLILAEHPDWTGAQIGSIPSTYAAAYAVGQLVNGVLGQRYGTRRLMTLALLTASITNVLFSFANSLASMQVLWGVNGWGQSAGWALMVQALSNWNTSERRGTLIGKLSTCYQVGHVLSWLLAGTLCGTIGWRAAFLVPGFILIPMALIFWLWMRDSPEQAGLPPIRDDLGEGRSASSSDTGEISTWRILKLTLGNRVLWILAIAFFVMNMVRYSFLNWSVHYMTDFHERGIQASVMTAIVIPTVGALGALLAGYVSDTVFGNRRAPVCVIMLLGVVGACAAMALVPRGAWIIATILLGVAGFMIYGPDVLIAGAATVDFSHPKAASAATGFTMCLGALGAIFSGAGIGWLRDLGQGNWTLVFGVLAALPLIPSSLLMPLWNARPGDTRI